MEVAEQLIDEVVRELDAPDADETATVSWFAARQPGIVRYLASRLGDQGDAMSVALYYACAIHRAFEVVIGMAPERAPFSLIERAERAFLEEAMRSLQVMDGLAQRQPALAALVAGVVESPPVPLAEEETISVGVALAAVAYALDEMASGRQVP
jgi:hypothetical protein